nr:odorant binding protein 9 [Aromia bungii]
MKYVVGLLATVLAVSLAESEIFTEEQIKGLLVHHKPCLTIPTRDDEFGKRLANLDVIDDEQLKDYLFCVSKRIGFQNEAGDIRKEVLVEMIRNSKKNTPKAEEYVDICLANKNDSPTDTIYKVASCMRSKLWGVPVFQS